MEAHWEGVPGGGLVTNVVDPNSGIGDTSVVSRFGERLSLTVSIASSRSSSHFVSSDLVFYSRFGEM